ncbi:MAG: hypothetical protein M1828_004207 [Chrysothrix sp. TS-e1954]|nr:MAG: hypothetical protein M1828_004207 [Chrysothrix sp. TS-e1954]
MAPHSSFNNYNGCSGYNGQKKDNHYSNSSNSGNSVSQSSSDRRFSNSTKQSSHSISASELRPGQLVHLPNCIPGDSIIHMGLKNRPFGHPAIVKAIDDNVATIFVTTTHGDQPLRERYAGARLTQHMSRRRWWGFQNAEDKAKWDHPDDGVPTMRFRNNERLAKPSYLAVNQVYKVECKYLSWHNINSDDKKDWILDACSLKHVQQWVPLDERGDLKSQLEARNMLPRDWDAVVNAAKLEASSDSRRRSCPVSATSGSTQRASRPGQRWSVPNMAAPPAATVCAQYPPARHLEQPSSQHGMTQVNKQERMRGSWRS